jgi:hypothetical protein
VRLLVRIATIDWTCAAGDVDPGPAGSTYR